jgi:hypothetical protein
MSSAAAKAVRCFAPYKLLDTSPTLFFEAYTDKVRTSYNALLQAELVLASRLELIPSKGGIYVFYQEEQPIYVGRTRNLRKRIRQHSHPGSNHNSASFAFLMARRETAGLSLPKLTRLALAEHASFEPVFAQCRTRIGEMLIRWVEEEDPIVQSLLEIYAAVTLQTTNHYNSFRTT